MRKILFTVGLILIVMGLPKLSFSQLLSNPESVEYDSELNRHFVSNYGNGNIIQIFTKSNVFKIFSKTI